MKYLERASITENHAITDAVWKMVLKSPQIAGCAHPGQFVMLEAPGPDLLLRRPLSIADADSGKGTVTFIYRLVGKGTKRYTKLRAGDVLSLEGPLGTGFTLGRGRELLVGGGVGIAPLIFLARLLPVKPVLLIGGRTAEELFWKEFLEPHAEEVLLTTDDGTAGVRGTTVDRLPDALAEYDVEAIKSCGPAIMMKGVAAIAGAQGKPCEVSLETRMGCGFGVCLGCTFEGRESGRRRKICTEGPVFSAKEVFG
ncbi:dihydroorotate dehydrogenase electron transfer subunit [Selenomonas sp. TAMA-11512]|uniref:dihydroorotate dehydrogenase electron transfer subunit n=1 Tax=Selenomonas sp. TAMA-11512 TaxID=3095337 RepID=UPI00308CC67A|nr:dihydroorotate dehydrogenase electron transfer subunit [Selenomonas sp. TAMA-11512]